MTPGLNVLTSLLAVRKKDFKFWGEIFFAINVELAQILVCTALQA